MSPERIHECPADEDVEHYPRQTGGNHEEWEPEEDGKQRVRHGDRIRILAPYEADCSLVQYIEVGAAIRRQEIEQQAAGQHEPECDGKKNPPVPLRR